MSSWLTSEWAKDLRQHWNDYDPIGVYSFGEVENEWPKDEYDSYHGVILRHLNKGSSHASIVKDIKQVVTVNIGITWNAHLEKNTNKFVSNVLSWFETKKLELKK